MRLIFKSLSSLKATIFCCYSCGSAGLLSVVIVGPSLSLSARRWLVERAVSLHHEGRVGCLTHQSLRLSTGTTPNVSFLIITNFARKAIVFFIIQHGGLVVVVGLRGGTDRLALRCSELVPS